MSQLHDTLESGGGGGLGGGTYFISEDASVVQ